MIVKHGKLAAIDHIITDGLTVSGDGVRLPVGLQAELVKQIEKINPIETFVKEHSAFSGVGGINIQYDTDTNTWLVSAGELSAYVTHDEFSATLVNYYTSEEVDELVNRFGGYKKVPYDDINHCPLVDDPQTKYIYLTKPTSAATTSANNAYEAWIWSVSSDESSTGYWECIDETSVNLDGYATEQWVEQQGYLKENDISAFSADLATKLDISAFDSYSASIIQNFNEVTTELNNKVDKTVFELYSAEVSADLSNIHTDLDKKLYTSAFNAYSAAIDADLLNYVNNSDLGNLIVALYTATTYTVGDYCIRDKKFYKCTTNISSAEEWNPSHWTEVTLVDMIRESNKLGNSITASITVGGIEAGDTIAAGTSYDDVFNALLNPALYPTLTDPSVSLSYGATTYYEVGSTVSAMTATVTFNRGSISPAYGTSGYRSGVATNYSLSTSGADNEYSSSSESSGSFNVFALTRATKGNIIMTATVSYAAGEQPKDSKGNNYSSPLSSGSKTATKTMQFIQVYFYGKSSTSTVSNFTGLSKSVTIKGQKQFSFTTNNEYMVVAYDSSYGDLTSILDQNGFETISGWTKSSLTVDGFSYYVYVANSATTDTNAQFTFKY